MKPTRRSKAVLTALVLAFVGVYLLMGCIYIPTWQIMENGEQNPSKAVGKSTSERPLRTSRSSRQQVVEYLGEPWFTSADKQTVGYRWRAITGLLAGCDMLAVREHYVLLLRFDEGGTLKTFEVKKDRPAVRQAINQMLPLGEQVEPEPPPLY